MPVKFSYQAFDDFCMSLEITIEYPFTYVYTQNDLAESFIKQLQLIARLLLMNKTFVSIWSQAILHADALVRI